MKNILNYILILILSLTMVGCGPQQYHHHKRKYIPMSNGSYAYYDATQNIWFYLWLSEQSTNNSRSNSSSGTINFPQAIRYVERSTYAPSARGLSVNGSGKIVEQESKEEPQAEELVEETNEMASEIGDEAAIESFENEGGAIITETDEVNADSQGADSVDSSSDSGSSDSGSSGDSGGGDSGGGDGGGGGGD